MRAVIGTSALLECRSYLFRFDAEPRSLAAGLILVMSGSLLLIGFRTPIAGLLFAAVKIATSASWPGHPIQNAIDDWATLYAVTIAIAIALLGPGSLSLDYRLFGPREIIFPAAGRRS